MSVHAGCARRWRIVWRPVDWKIRHIIPCPYTLLLIPPQVFLALRPGATLWISRGAIIENTPISRPGKTPLQVGILTGDTRRGQVLVRCWIHTTVNPGAAGRASIALECGKIWYVWSVAQRVHSLPICTAI